MIFFIFYYSNHFADNIICNETFFFFYIKAFCKWSQTFGCQCIFFKQKQNNCLCWDYNMHLKILRICSTLILQSLFYFLFPPSLSSSDLVFEPSSHFFPLCPETPSQRPDQDSAPLSFSLVCWQFRWFSFLLSQFSPVDIEELAIIYKIFFFLTYLILLS